GPALLDQTDHRVGLSHPISDRIMGQDNAGHDHNAMSVLGPYQAAMVNRLRLRRVPCRWKKVCIKGSHTRLPYRVVQKSGQFWVRARRASKLTTNSAFS